MEASVKASEGASRGALLAALVADQHRLTAVERFSRRQELDPVPADAGMYRDLLPLSSPKAGQQLAFEVDLDKCSGCKACVTACHSLNGLDPGEAWRDVGRLVGTQQNMPFEQTVTSACHHCVEPACANGCPVLAYEKDPGTGIVRHLDDQCIGCQYCVWMCPYDVPKYLPERGIVRKCDMCSQRLAVGEAPACAQACPNEAIRITIVDQKEITREFRKVQADAIGANPFLPGTPDPALTLPSTQFRSEHPLPADLAPSLMRERPPEAAHWPLVWMLVLTQGAVGASWLSACFEQLQPWLGKLGLTATMLGMGAGVLHLGRPFHAWRSFLGLRRSWLSREIVAFSGFGLLAAVLQFGASPWPRATAIMAALAGLAGVVCSGMIYHATARPFWRGRLSLGKFMASTLVLGWAAAWWAAEGAGDRAADLAAWSALGLALFATMKLGSELAFLGLARRDLAEQLRPRVGEEEAWSLARSAALMRKQFVRVTVLRFVFGVSGGVAVPLAGLALSHSHAAWAMAGLVLCGLGEVAERYLFFRAVIPPGRLS